VTRKHTRRSLLTAAGAGALTVGTLGVVAQESVAATYRLAMTETGWMGQAPAAISDTATPTLQMRPGQDYRVQVTNQTDGRHNFVLSGSYPTGPTLVRTRFVDPGESLETTVTAQPGLSAYFCEQHPEEVGPVVVGEGAAGVDNATAANATGAELNTTGNITGLPGNVSGNATVDAANLTNLVNDSDVGANTTAGGDLAGTSPVPAKTFKFVGSGPRLGRDGTTGDPGPDQPTAGRHGRGNVRLHLGERRRRATQLHRRDRRRRTAGALGPDLEVGVLADHPFRRHRAHARVLLPVPPARHAR